MGGCIPMLIQMPILIAMFRFFPASIELREQPSCGPTTSRRTTAS